MTTKTLTITENAYENLLRIKAENESFSQLFLRIAKERVFVKDLKGRLAGNAETFQKRIKEIRKKTGKEAGKRYEHLRQLSSHRNPA